MMQLTDWLAQHAGHRRLLVPDFTSVRWVSSQLAQQGVATLGLRVEVESDVRLAAADPFPAYWPESRRLRAVSDALKRLPENPWHTFSDDSAVRRALLQACRLWFARTTDATPTTPRDATIVQLANALQAAAPPRPATPFRTAADEAPCLTVRTLQQRMGVQVHESSVVPLPARRVECPNPETEVAFMSREIIARQTDATVFCAPHDVARWVNRLRAHGAPVRASLPLASAGGAVEVWLASALAVVTQDYITLEELTDALLSRAAIHDEQQADTLQAARSNLAGQRRRRGTREQWTKRIQAQATRLVSQLSGKEDADAAEVDLQRAAFEKQRIERAETWLTQRLNQLGECRTPQTFLEWLQKNRVAKFPSAEENLFFRAFCDQLITLQSPSFKPEDLYLLDDVRARIGYSSQWIDDIPESTQGPVIEVVPWGTVYDATGRDCWLTGLDSWPPAPSTTSLFTAQFEAQAGMHDAVAEFNERMHDLNLLLHTGQAQALSWRVTDASGSAVPLGPWVASLPHASQGVTRIGLNELSPAADATPCSVWEHRVRWPVAKDDLRLRVHATSQQHVPAITPFTGQLGVRVQQEQFSISSLQSWAGCPWRYFAERLLGARDPDLLDDTWDHRETGTIVHNVLEKWLQQEIGSKTHPRDEANTRLLTGSIQIIAEHVHNKHAADLFDPVVVNTTANRWKEELAAWATDRQTRAINAKDELKFWQVPGKVVELEKEIAPTKNPFLLRLSDDVMLPLAGRIDLLEQLADNEYAIVDFKTGEAVSENNLHRQIAGGLHLQLPLYAMALKQQQNQDIVAARLEFVTRKTKKFPVAALSFTDDQKYLDPTGNPAQETPLQVAARFAALYMKLIRSGYFPLTSRGNTSAAPAAWRTPGGAKNAERLQQIDVHYTVKPEEKTGEKKESKEEKEPRGKKEPAAKKQKNGAQQETP